MGGQDLTQPFPTDDHDPDMVVGQVGDQLADTPPGEGLTQASGRWLAVSTMNASSSVVIRRGRPPAH